MGFHPPGGQSSFGSDEPLTIGQANVVWDTADANANVFKLDLPAGDVTNSPTFCIGIGIEGQDLGVFNGETEPGLAILNAARTKALEIRWGTTFFDISSPLGSAQINIATPLNVSSPVIMGANLNWQFYNGSGSAFMINSSGFLRIYGSNDAIHIGSTGSSSLIPSPANGDFYINKDLEVNGQSYFGGDLNLSDAVDINVGTTTGTKFGSATSQKISFWNATPVIQPTTGIAAAAFVANTSGIADDSATWDGYTIGQVVAALRQVGLLA